MTTQSHAGADRAPEESTPDEVRNVRRAVWLLRGIGAVLLIAGWAVLAPHDFGSARFFLSTAIFIGLGAYAYAAAATARRTSVELERRLRHRLLVHNMELANMAMRDDLTQLFNRRYLFERLEHELQTASRLDKPLSVMIIDLDCMKAVNDTYGHRVGDRLLASFGRFLSNQTRASDIAARIGGDEFAVLLPDTGKEAASALIGRIAQKLEGADLIEEPQFTLRTAASFGLSGYPWSGTTADTLMQQADAEMYASKHQKKLASSNGSPPDSDVTLPLRAGEPA